MEASQHIPEEEKLFRGVLKLHINILGIACGLIGGLLIFLATNWLVIKGGKQVGPHLQLLGQYFPGYRVTFGGSLIGFAYGFVVGGACGMLVGWLYNSIVAFKTRNNRFYIGSRKP
jgi:hypothetical protein